ncbi:EpsD family peptidyl-prolyl cis-trans isomerase [Pseudokordiimonas caeni]|uniref:EpsD family peptidyl-prolyl cis-trans isomerase n=1 Tax=Pseudokordiimonas caeni TaxID=2997908 RepID=UPI002810BB4D|nr:EpsD family peptidyl-prolyl cis-trans isomerase [Pseudokordiimonas caeni]
MGWATQKNNLTKAAAIASVLVLAACGGGDDKAESGGGAPEAAKEGGEQTPSSQVVANVNGEEVTIHELNSELSRINIPADADRQAIEENVLRAIVNRKVLEQKAVGAGLDRVPGVIAEIRRSRSTLLAQAYMRSQASGAQTVSRQEAEKFILDNPNLFANRTYYIFDAILAPSDALPEEKKDAFEALGNLDEIERQLSNSQINNQRKPYTAFSETIPSAMQEKLPELMRDRTVFFVVQGPRTMITQFQESRPASLTGEDALRVATRMLQGRNNRETMMKVQSEALEQATVSFSGKFASMTKNPPNLVDGKLQREIDSSVQQPDAGTGADGDTDEAGGPGSLY